MREQPSRHPPRVLVARLVGSPVALASVTLLLADPTSPVALHDLGGTGPAVLICHATGFCGRAYEPLAAVLTSRFRVWAIDFPGHGDSPVPADGDFRWEQMTRHVKAATREISVEPLACVVGHSMGGAVALQAAAEEPGLFAAAYVFEPIVATVESLAAHEGPNPMAEAARRRQSSFPSKAAAMWRYAARPPLRELDAGSLAAYVEHGFSELDDGTVGLKCAPESEARTFESSGGITTHTIAAAVIPTLCVSGGTGSSPMAGMAPPVAAGLPNAALRVHRHLGHFGPLQSPGLIGDEIADHARP